MRLKDRKTRLWHQNYLSYRCLWPNLAKVIELAKNNLSKENNIVLDIGCGEKPYRDLFDGLTYIGINYGTSGSTPDIVGDALLMPISNSSAGIVFSTQVLEHIPDPQKMLNECYRVLNEEGTLVLSAPFYWPMHEVPFDYFRFTYFGLESLLKTAGFRQWEIYSDGGDWSQSMLSINLKIPKLLWPLRIMFNVIGLLLDKFDKREILSPANYTLIAYKNDKKLNNG